MAAIEETCQPVPKSDRPFQFAGVREVACNQHGLPEYRLGRASWLSTMRKNSSEQSRQTCTCLPKPYRRCSRTCGRNSAMAQPSRTICPCWSRDVSARICAPVRHAVTESPTHVGGRRCHSAHPVRPGHPLIARSSLDGGRRGRARKIRASTATSSSRSGRREVRRSLIFHAMWHVLYAFPAPFQPISPGPWRIPPTAC